MADDILQRFLTHRLIDVGGDENRLARLREAAGELSETLKTAPERIAAFTMVAMEARIGADEPILEEVGQVLLKHWNSYPGSFADDMQRSVFRAIILDALMRLAMQDAPAAAIAMTARNFLPLIGEQVDRDIWKDLVEKASHRLEGRARREWSVPSATSAHEHKLELAGPALTPPTSSRTWLAGRLAAASGPTTKDGKQTEGNPHWPDSPQEWSHNFAPMASDAITAQIDAQIKALTERLVAAGALSAGAEAIQTYVMGAVADLVQAATGLERRMALLWWKEALFSPLAGSSYREMPLVPAMAAMAIDASVQAGPYAPRMAESLLLETVRALSPGAFGEEVELVDLMAQVDAAPSTLREKVHDGFHHVYEAPGRTPLASLVRHPQFDAAVVQKRLGLTGDFALTPAKFSLWLFRDLQAAAPSRTAAQKRKRKA